ncbi:IS110 family transposase [Mucilaginibacter ginsenosidivorans]|uniref:IS110 family transposase n=1 Tax=Mucilaginibacter ginsenosidivorans TaxID=398053 RepID=A0A5B8UR85_9SPHI|nr:transposase [Mucilaginibacter ginsenosidivorans]QEC61402.1 IS110 family transposase [Mucilaginibacter ginsenosidivorans]QEC61403.1 IS110 family transposase [Mucilaginibacter ginsenosidivorans]QEC63500.1 IS110 family transposase [Mucilaginibacter ginsenosidivorans]QEC63655.1 IS110 family transposase [Mucilaginibacter ginsenosidivorans]
MKSWNVILGVDVSKLTLDICCAERNLHIKIDNCSKGFTILKKWCRTNEIDLNQTLMVMEYTGGYEYRFMQFCESLSISYSRIPGLEIKQSMGMTRGKSDQADAFRIGQYGEEKSKRLKPSKPLDNNILKLKQLLSFRKRLVREKAGLESTVKERGHMYSMKKADTVTHIAQSKIKADKKYIIEVEQEIMKVIKGDESMLLTYRIITSIKGIGPVNAWMTIAYTENFTSFTDARKYAVYVGVIPFEHTSGTSIKGRKQVSHLAHKGLKNELNQAAKTAIAHDPELKAYAERKLENKCYPLVLNNVKFKLILRMFSLVKRGELYAQNYKRAA